MGKFNFVYVIYCLVGRERWATSLSTTALGIKSDLRNDTYSVDYVNMTDSTESYKVVRVFIFQQQQMEAELRDRKSSYGALDLVVTLSY